MTTISDIEVAQAREAALNGKTPTPRTEAMMEPYLVKLVRDKMGDGRFDAPGIEYRPIEDRDEAIKLLRQKLIEEAAEYIVNPSVDEMADIEETCLALAQIDLQVSPTQIETARVCKRSERGGFDKLTGMYTTVVSAKSEAPDAH